MSARGVVAHAIVATLLLAGAAEATSRGPADERRYARPRRQRPAERPAPRRPRRRRRRGRGPRGRPEGRCGGDQRDRLPRLPRGERGAAGDLRARPGRGALRQRGHRLDPGLLGLPGDGARGAGHRDRAGHPGAADQPRAVRRGSCATCVTATAAFQVVAQVDAVGPLPDPVLAEITAWFDAQAAALQSAVVAPPAPRRAERAATRSLGDLRRVVVRALDGRTRSARVSVTR